MSRRSKEAARQPPTAWAVARRPLLILILLLAILAANTALAFLPVAGWQFTGNVLLAAASVALIGIVFMELDQSSMLDRLFAAVGFAFLLIFAMLIFSDYLTRV